jgi:hypothetical protein
MARLMMVEISLGRWSTVMSAGKRVAVRNHDIGKLARGNHADLVFEAHEPGIVLASCPVEI